MIGSRQLVAFACVLVSGAVHAVDFQRDVRPILANHCFKCHGPDDKARKAKLRLDVRPEQDVLKEVLLRIDHADVDERMPPAAAKKPLSGAQKRCCAIGSTKAPFTPSTGRSLRRKSPISRK